MDSIEGILKKVKALKLLDTLTAEVWLSFLLSENRLYLLKNPLHLLDPVIVDKFWNGVKEMDVGKPLAQMIGYKEFYGMDFVVTENVLIPRPESELLVDLVKGFIGKRSAQVSTVVDVGTGSGCILLAILKENEGLSGIGIEKSHLALNVARENGEKHDLNHKINWIEGDLLLPVNEKVDIIVANLPYIGTEKFNFVAGNVAEFEPDIALYGGSDGLDLYRRMFKQLAEKDWKPAMVVGEFGFGQSEEMEKLLLDYYSAEEFRIIPDLASIPRVFVINSAP